MTLAKTTKYEKLTLTELGDLLKAAGKDDVVATERLCDQFKYLVYKEADNSFIKDYLGEDAINIAWIGFLEAIKKYDGKGVARFLRYVKDRIRFALIDEIRRLFPMLGAGYQERALY